MLFLLQHDLCGFDYRGYAVADLELHLLRAALTDQALDHIFTGANDHMGHHASQFDLDYFAFDSIARGECHARNHTLVPRLGPAEWAYLNAYNIGLT